MLRPLLLLALAAAALLRAAEPAAGTLVVSLDGALPLRAAADLFGEHAPTLHEATADLRQALRAPEPTVVLDLSAGFAPSLAAAEELAAVLRDERGAHPGKRLIALVDGLDDRGMVLAAACDEVVASEAGALAVMGLSLDSWYLADALAKLGVRFHAVASGEHKTAPEALTRNAPSAAAQADLRRLVDGLDEVLVSLAARGGATSAAFADLRAAAPQTSGQAVALGLADRTAEIGAWLEALPAPVRWLHEREPEPDLASLGGIIAFWGRLLDGERQARHARAVAVVELEGEIVDGADSAPGQTIAGEDTSALFDDLAGDERIAAVVLRINSPGGSATASDRIHHAVRRCAARKPVVALFDGLAASGGYYIGCAAQEVLVHRSSITGSIGVFAVVPDASGTLGLLGIHRHAVSTGPLADLDDPTAPYGPERQAALERLVRDIDQRFQGVVAAARRLPPERVAALAGGQVFTGVEAVANGLADGFGSLPAAVARARARAGIAEPLPVERLPRPQGLLGRLGLAQTRLGVAPARLRLWLDGVRGRVPAVMAWCNLRP